MQRTNQTINVQLFEAVRIKKWRANASPQIDFFHFHNAVNDQKPMSTFAVLLKIMDLNLMVTTTLPGWMSKKDAHIKDRSYHKP